MKATRNAFLPALLGILVMSGIPGHVAGQDEGSASVAVQNNGENDAQVYALQGGHMVPLGLVSAGESTTLALPATLVGDIRLSVDLIGSPDWHMSEPVAASPQGTVELTIEPELARSSVRATG